MNFEDIYLVPAPFCSIESRKDVNPSVTIAGETLSVPIIASCMDTVYSPKLSQETLKFGAQSVVHRFCSVEENVSLFKQGQWENKSPWVSVGTTSGELERAEALVNVGANVVVIDVANGSQIASVKQYNALRDLFKSNISIVVGNFATGYQIDEFNNRIKTFADGYRIGVGTGGNCITATEATGFGLPHVETLLSCAQNTHQVPLIFDGGTKTPADFCKMLGLGASAVMMGRQFAATIESGAASYAVTADGFYVKPSVGLPATYKRYRGSASKESYEAQGKTASHRPVEGRESFIPITGTVEEFLTSYQASLRSAMSYADAVNLFEYIGKVNWDKK